MHNLARTTVGSGVPQGCLVSGSIFTAALRPLWEMLANELGPSGVFIYADDVAVVLPSIRGIGRVQRIFQAFGDVTGLRLKPQKCRLLPLRLHDAHELDNVARYAAGLASMAPMWSNMKAAYSGEYLGVNIGPGPTLAQRWEKLAAKYAACCRDFSRA